MMQPGRSDDRMQKGSLILLMAALAANLHHIRYSPDESAIDDAPCVPFFLPQ